MNWTCPLCGLTFRGLTARHYPIRCGCGTKKPSENEPAILAASRGLGDTVAKMTRRVGIKPCGGCKERQRILNQLVPYR